MRTRDILARCYKEETSKKLNLDNPRTFSEKVQWLKLYGQNSQMASLLNSGVVRKKIKEVGGEEFLAPILASWSCPEEVLFESLPKSFLLRANSWRRQMREVRGWKSAAQKHLEQWAVERLCTNSAVQPSLELAYANATPCLTVEPLTQDGRVDSTRYAVDCFNGRALLVWVYDGLDKNNSCARLYTPNWQFLYRHHNVSDLYEDKKPRELDMLLELSERLTEGIAVCTVYFRLLEGRVVFEEFDPYPNSGFRLWDDYLDRCYGSEIELPAPSALPGKSFAERGVGSSARGGACVQTARQLLEAHSKEEFLLKNELNDSKELYARAARQNSLLHEQLRLDDAAHRSEVQALTEETATLRQEIERLNETCHSLASRNAALSERLQKTLNSKANRLGAALAKPIRSIRKLK